MTSILLSYQINLPIGNVVKQITTIFVDTMFILKLGDFSAMRKIPQMVHIFNTKCEIKH